jgi:hypothetical protein
MIPGQSDADAIKEQELRAPEGDQSGLLDQSDPKVVYMTGDQGPFKCGHCSYYVDPNACQKVSGDIDPEGCCNLYESVEAGQ